MPGDAERERRGWEAVRSVRMSTVAERVSTRRVRVVMAEFAVARSDDSWAMEACASWRAEERCAHAWPSEVASARVCRKAV
jgi:hypothetical protein